MERKEEEMLTDRKPVEATGREADGAHREELDAVDIEILLTRGRHGDCCHS